LKNIYSLFVIALAIAAAAFSGFAGDVETLFDSPKLNTDRPFFTSLKIAPDGKTAWAGTQKSILRFTGAKRDEFTRENVPAFAEASCYNFKPLAFDAKGTLWVGLSCYKGTPLALYDGSEWKIVTRDILPLPADVKQVEHMAFGKDGILWLATYSGLLRYDGKEWTLFSPENSPLPHRQITALNIDRKGVVWIGTGKGDIVKFDGMRWEVFKAGTAGLQPGGMAKSIKFDTNGVMYFVNYTGGAYRYAAGKFQLIGCGSECYFEDVAFDAQNVLWIANNFKRGARPAPGLLRLDGKKLKSFNLPNNSSWWLGIDAAGNKWIATSGKFEANGSIILFCEGGVKLSQ